MVTALVHLTEQIHKLHIAISINVPTILNNSKAKVNDLDLGKLKTVSVDLKKLSE